jgi:hypothetical protein
MIRRRPTDVGGDKIKDEPAVALPSPLSTQIPSRIYKTNAVKLDLLWKLYLRSIKIALAVFVGAIDFDQL